MQRFLLLAFIFCSALHAEPLITWKRLQLGSEFYAEGATAGDINGDGKVDVVSGPFWWEGPTFEKKHAFYAPHVFDINGYSDNFFAYVYDFNADSKNDILVLGFPGKEARLYLNPGVHDDKPWPMSIVADVVDNESPVFKDITGDGKPEIVCSTGGKFGWFAPTWDKPTDKWPFVYATDDMKVAKFTHGLGVGDVNGDGQMDLLEARRWWENTGSFVKSGVKTANFIQHNFAAGVGGGAQMFAYDFDGNGTNDVFTALAAHRYGVAVYLQNKPAPDKPLWKQVMLASENPADNDYGIVFSQPHAADLADINGDGIKDIVVGKRYWAHNGHDPDERGHRVVYWYETKRDGKGGVDFIPHLIDAESGVGVDVQAIDVNDDKLLDIVVGNKAGVYVLLQQRKEATTAESAAMQPRKMYGPALKAQADYAHGLSPTEALAAMQLPTGFHASLIASEPDIVQPIAFTFDERGRIWVLEGMSYPQPREVGQGKDRIKILEDKDGDGRYETITTFCEGINLGSGIELGFGGVWVGAAPYLMFIPRDGDSTLPLDRAYKTYETYSKVPGLPFTAYALLDGFGSQDTHETLNAFIWGPDGWLYGCHGVFTHSLVGKPGTTEKDRTPINAGVWRYHPVRHEFEVFAQGTSNPWGLDYDQNGEFFVTACVIPHLYHIVPGARYHRQGGQHFNPYTYEDIETIADHAHFAGNPRPDVTFDKTTGAGVMNNDTNAAGGGHAHCGLAIYQSDLFPPIYRNALIFGNLHGHRLVSDYVDPHGSTFVGKHGSDFMRSNDMNFIPVTQKVGPDGALYVSDWSDKQVCHRGSGAVELWDRSNGRIYRVGYGVEDGKVASGFSRSGTSSDKATAQGAVTPAVGNTKSPTPANRLKPGTTLALPRSPFDLAKESDETLAKLAVQTENEWFSRMARRVLMERSANGNLTTLTGRQISDASNVFLRYSVKVAPDSTQLRALWGLHAIGFQLEGHGVEASHLDLVDDEHAAVWNIRLLADDHLLWDHEAPSKYEEVVSILVLKTAQKAAYPSNRREFASLLQKIPFNKRPALARALLAHGEDKDDPYIPLLIWYGIEPVVGADPKVGLELAKVSKMPKVTEFIYRRMGAEEAGRTGLLKLAAETKDAAQRDALLNTVLMAARAGNKIAMPEDWAALRAKVVQGFSPSGTAASQTAPNAKPGASNQPSGLKPETTLRELEAFMGIKEAIASFRAVVADNQAPLAERESAIALLAQVRDTETAPLLLSLLSKASASTMQPTRRAIQALATLPSAETPKVLVTAFASLDAATQQDAINTLCTSAAGATAMLTAMKAKSIPQTYLSPFLARQIDAFDNAEVRSLLKEVFGDLNAPKADLAERKAKYRTLLTPAILGKADKAKGKVIFNAICGQCHKLFGEGQNVGPDLTGSNRATLDYLLDNVLDPNAVIGKAYQLNLFELNDGRVASGVIKEETPAAYRIAMPGGMEQTVTVAEVKKRTISKASTMPEGLFDALPPETLQQLVAYLQSNATPAAAVGGSAKVEGALEGEALKILGVTGKGKTRMQGMGGFRASKWSAGQQLWWTNGATGDTLSLAVPVAAKGKYKITAVLTKALDYGMATVKLNGHELVSTPIDFYEAVGVVTTGELNWGVQELEAGEAKLEITLSSANPAAKSGNMVGLDYVKLEKQ